MQKHLKPKIEILCLKVPFLRSWHICISDKINMPCLLCLVEYWFHHILECDRKTIMLCSMAFPSKLCSALHGQSNVCSMCDCKPCRSLDLSVLVEILSGVEGDHGTGPRRNGSVKVNIMSNRKKVMLTEDAPLSSHLADYVL